MVQKPLVEAAFTGFPLRVLYLHPAAAFGGASKSLIELFGSLRDANVSGAVLTPTGTASNAFAKAGLVVYPVKGLSQFDNTRHGHYRGLRWIILLRELFLLPTTLLALWRIRHEQFDLIHVNEVTLLPLGVLAKKLLRIPMVVHVRSLQCTPNSNWRTKWVNGMMSRHAANVVAIDLTVAKTLAQDLPVSIIHNGFNIAAGAGDCQRTHCEGMHIRVGFCGVLLPVKGIYELMEAMRILKSRRVEVECWVIGENVRELTGFKEWILRQLGLARNVRMDLEVLVEKYGLGKDVRLLGFVRDVRNIYSQLDILCFPSHLDAAGRPVFEAAFYGVPSVVAVENPASDALVHGVTGLAISRPDPELIADAIQRLAEDDEYRTKLGRQARDWAIENFSLEASVRAVQSTYKHALANDGRRAKA